MVNDEMRRIMKGILLAGGARSRLHPATKAISKHFMMVYDKPLIYYSLSNLMLAGIREVLLISSARDLEFYKNLFSDGKSLGIRIDYEVQDSPNGIPEAFIIGESFIKNSKGDIVMRVIDPSIASEYLIDYLDDTQMRIWIGYYFQILQQQ